MLLAGRKHEHMAIGVAKEQMIVVVNGHIRFAVKGISAVSTCFSYLILKLGGKRIRAIVTVTHTFIRCLRPLPRFAMQSRQVSRRNKDIARPSAVIALNPFFVPHNAWHRMSHAVAMHYAPATIELCCCHHFFISAAHPSLPFFFFHLKGNQETAPVAFAVAELTGIKGRGIESHHAEAMRKPCCFVNLSLITFAVRQQNPFIRV